MIVIMKFITKIQKGMNGINMKEIKEYDNNGNLIYLKIPGRIERWRKYDPNGNLIYSKNSNGFEEWLEYDSNNNLIRYKNSYGYESWF